MLGLDLLAALTFSLVASSHQYELSQADWMSHARYTHTQLRRGPDYAGVQQYRRPIVKTRHPVDWCAPGACPFIAVWSLDEADSTTRLNDRDASCGTACDLTDVNGTGQDTTNFLEGVASADFVQANAEAVTCTDANCGGTTRLDLNADFTFGAWARPRSLSTDNTPIIGKAQAGAYYAIYTKSSGDAVQCVMNGTASSHFSDVQTSATAVDEWMHTACRYDNTAGDFELMIDAVGTGSPTNFTDVPIDTSGPFDLGRLTDFPNTWDGRTDEAWAIHDLLTTAEVCRICACQIDGKKCACDTATPTSYASCSTDADCAGEALCSTGGLCEGRRVSECSSCTLPSCNVAAP
jgi:hypothetical protein